MSENKHTPEPWRAFNNGQGVVGVSTDRSDVCWTRIADGSWLDSDKTIDADYENARRIVACVNRLAQFTTEQIEDFGYDLFAEDRPRLVEAQNEIHLLKKQRDELLAGLEHFATWARGQHKAQSKGCHATFDMMMLRDEIDFAEAAIASVKEKK